MVVVFKSGKMAANMKATGKMIWPTVEAALFTLMAMSMKASGLTIRLTVVAPTFTWTALNIPVSGEKTNSMDSALKLGLMVQSTKVTTSMERSMAPVLLNGLTDPCISASFITIIFTERASTHGPMAVSMKANGETTKCTEKELSPGPTGESMWVSTLMIKSKAMVNLSGPMEDAIRATGKVVNNMVKVFTSRVRVMKSMENGKMERESDGLVKRVLNERDSFVLYMYYINKII